MLPRFVMSTGRARWASNMWAQCHGLMLGDENRVRHEDHYRVGRPCGWRGPSWYWQDGAAVRGCGRRPGPGGRRGPRGDAPGQAAPRRGRPRAPRRSGHDCPLACFRGRGTEHDVFSPAAWRLPSVWAVRAGHGPASRPLFAGLAGERKQRRDARTRDSLRQRCGKVATRLRRPGTTRPGGRAPTAGAANHGACSGVPVDDPGPGLQGRNPLDAGAWLGSVPTVRGGPPSRAGYGIGLVAVRLGGLRRALRRVRDVLPGGLTGRAGAR